MKYAYVEISNLCNLHCSFCPSAQGVPPRSMGLSLFEAVLDFLRGHVQEIFFHVLGEPLLHPQLRSFLKMSGDSGLPVNITTNGILIDRQKEVLLASPALRQINFSLHALEEMPDREEALRTLVAVLHFSRTAMELRPELYVNFRLWNEGADSGDWNALVRQRIERFFDIPSLPSVFQVRNKSIPVAGRVYVHSDSRFDWPGSSPEAECRTRGTCHALESHIGILSDGRIVACCLDYEGHLELGRVPGASFEDVMDSPRARAMREGFAVRRLVEPFCQKCSFCRRFPA